MQTAALANDHLAKLKSTAKTPLQPLIYFVGDILKNNDIRASIMIVDTFYLFDDPIKAVDTYFAIMISGKFFYPHSSENHFKIIEKLIMRTSRNSHLPSSYTTFINELINSIEVE